jgi:hypothetical protein
MTERTTKQKAQAITIAFLRDDRLFNFYGHAKLSVSCEKSLAVI